MSKSKGNNNNSRNDSVLFSAIAQTGLVNQQFNSDAITATIKVNITKSFNDFYLAFMSLYTLKTTKSEIIQSFIRFVLFFYGIVLSHNSKFVSWLNTKAVQCIYPSFVFAYLLGIAAQVNTTQTGNGFISGVLKQQLTFEETIDVLLNDAEESGDMSVWETLAEGTTFHQIFSDKRQIALLRKDIIKVLTDLKNSSIYTSDEDVQFYMVNCFLRDIRLALTDNSIKNLAFKDDKIKYSTSRNLGIYRYRNKRNQPETYLTHRSMEGNLKVDSASQQLAFLRIFLPKLSVSDLRIPGDTVLTFDDVPVYVAWLTYLSMAFSSSGEKPKDTPPKKVENKSDTPIEGVRQFSTSTKRYYGSALKDFGIKMICNRPFPSLFIQGLIDRI